MADLGDIGDVQRRGRQGLHVYGFTLNKAPTNVEIHIDDALPYAGGIERHPVWFYTQFGTRVDGMFVDDAGNAYTYDLDDGGYYAQQVGTGNAWSITVTGTTVDIVKLSSFGYPISVYCA